MVVAEDLDAQLKGIVNVSYAVGAPIFKSVQVNLRTSIPLHIACQHFAYDDPFAYWSASRGIAMLTKNHRVRFRSHMGTCLLVVDGIVETIFGFLLVVAIET